EELSVQEQIQRLLATRGAMTPKEIADELLIPHNTTKVTLRRMTEKGILITVNNNKSTLYALKSYEPF
ncbi:MAG: BlaI/MecI/CopY family transcriptional regulator, partial [Thermodesulfovibrio sp.]|nr:BlaI/MecI/CopY family transcriptional regulator [Thermodesulfovibrio sp.]